MGVPRAATASVHASDTAALVFWYSRILQLCACHRRLHTYMYRKGVGMDDHMADLDRRLTALEQRFARLAPASAAPSGMSDRHTTGFADQLQQRLAAAAHAHDSAGLVAYAGVVRGAAGELAWEFERPVADVLALDLEPLA